jgi:mevalonate kinase
VYALTIVASAPAKIILFGEHFVVFGEPAVVLAIDRRAYSYVEPRKDKRVYINSVELGVSGFFEKERFQAEKGSPKRAEKELLPVKLAVQKILDQAKSDTGVSVEIRSDIPVAAGLGSSAAVAAATAKATGCLLGVKLSPEDIFNVAYQAERVVHGTPSGIDPTIATYGGVLRYSRADGFMRLDVKGEIPLVVGNTGLMRNTGDLVAKVRRAKEKYPSIVNPLIKAGGEIVAQAVETLRHGDVDRLGELMNLNHALLYAVGVSNELLERLICAARQAGALGAKLTGAGGGGCMIALAENRRLKKVAQAIQEAGGASFVAKKSDEGVRIES